MGNQSTPITSYKDTNTQIRQFDNSSPAELILSPDEFPFLSRISGGNAKSPALMSLKTAGGITSNPKLEWASKSLRPLSWTLSADITSGATNFWFVADGIQCVVNVIVKCEDEFMLVTANNGTSAVTVTRGYLGSTAAAHTTSKPVYFVTRAFLENDDIPSDPYITPDMEYNYVQQFAEDFVISDIEAGTDRYYEQDKVDEREHEKTVEILRAIEIGIFKNRTRQAFSATTPGLAAGAYSYISASNIVNKAGAALTRADITGLLTRQQKQGGQGRISNLVVCNGAAMEKLADLFSSGYVTLYRDNAEKVAGYAINKIQTNMGEVEILLSTYLDDTELWFFKEEYCGWGFMKDNKLRTEPVGITKLGKKWVTKCAGTYQQKSPASHGYIYNFT